MRKHQILEAKNIAKAYSGRTVVSNVSFSVESGQVVGLLGPNGAGKTTSFYMVIGLVNCDKGDILLNGESIKHLKMHERARKGIGYLPQEASIFRKLTVEENILTVLENRALPEKERNAELRHLLDDFNLNHVATQKGLTLSGGERRRVEVARAMAMNPSFLMLDEPFAGVDPIAVSDIQKMIQALKKRQIGILITDHNVRETLAICDLGVLLSDGTILVKGSPAEIASDPLAREKYLGENFEF